METQSKPITPVTTVAQVNAAIAKAGYKERLVLGRVGGTYLFFENIGERGAPSEPIELSDLSVYTVQEWLDKLRVARVEETLIPREDFLL
jgi:hypothetical protein